METLQATGTVRGVYFRLGTTSATSDPRTVHIAVYSLTEPDIVKAMIAANKLGVKVVIVADATESKNANQAAMIKALTQAGVDVRLAVRQTALMHNKVGIFDGHTVVTRSFKWTTNSENHNDGNLLVVDGPI